MDNTKQYQEQQYTNQLHNSIDQFISDFTVGRLFNKCGIGKPKGASRLELCTVIFKKNAFYAFLENPKQYWRECMLEFIWML